MINIDISKNQKISPSASHSVARATLWHKISGRHSSAYCARANCIKSIEKGARAGSSIEIVRARETISSLLKQHFILQIYEPQTKFAVF